MRYLPLPCRLRTISSSCDGKVYMAEKSTPKPYLSTISFYSPQGASGFLSNFSPHAVRVCGILWPTAEHFFQACKFPHDPERQKRIFRAPTPDIAKKIAWEEEAVYPADWFDERIEVMRYTLWLKFSQHGDLAELLQKTGEALLVERSDRDAFWGDGPDGWGCNMLGLLLMELRSELVRTSPL